MLKKVILSLLALVGVIAAVPSSAEARGRYHRGYDYGYVDPYYGRGHYAPRHYGHGYYAPRHYGYGYYAPRHYAPTYYGRPRYAYRDRYYGRRYRCGSGTTGAIIGGAAGALLGREIGRGGRGYYSYRRGSGTTGALIGGAAGALLGREIGRRC